MSTSNITIASACRDSAWLVDTFRRQCESVAWPHLRVAVCEGDSQDDTWARLVSWVKREPHKIKIAKYDTGAPSYGHIVDADRFKQLSRVFNRALDLVDLNWTDYVFFVPFDIMWKGRDLFRLWRHQVDMVSPLTWCEGSFYDTWALVQPNGETWHKFDAQWAHTHLGNGLLEMQAVGGTVLIDASVLRAGCRYTEKDVDRGLSACARSKGFQLWVDPGCWVYHPEPFQATAGPALSAECHQ